MLRSDGPVLRLGARDAGRVVASMCMMMRGSEVGWILDGALDVDVAPVCAAVPCGWSSRPAYVCHTERTRNLGRESGSREREDAQDSSAR